MKLRNSDRPMMELGYQSLPSRRNHSFASVVGPALRRLIFAAGCGLLPYGAGHLFSTHYYRDGITQWGWSDNTGPAAMGWGGAFIGLTIPIFGNKSRRD